MKKSLLLTCLGLLFGLLTQEAKATHLMGVDINYECINNCTIRVHLRAYRDCDGASGISIQDFEFQGASGCVLPTPVTAWVPAGNGSQPSHWFVTEVTPVCPGTVTQCVSGSSTIRGVEEYYRYRDYDICAATCQTYNLVWTGQNRNGGITSGAANQGMGVFVTSINTNLTPCNNSPYFSNPPTPYVCAGDTFVFNQGAIDPDGDSLAYSLGPCFDHTGNQVNYNTGYSPTAPLGTDWTVTVNASTGDVTFLPTPGGIEVGVMCIYVEEWRGGVLLNQIVRDMQVNVIPCPSNSSPSVPNIGGISGGIGNGGSGSGISVGTCVGSSLCFNLPAVDPNSGDTITMWWDQSLPGAQFFQTGNPTVQDTIIGVGPQATFCWTPPAPGNYSFVVNMRDNACPNYGFSQFSVSIFVSSPQTLANPGQDSCGTIDFCAFPLSGGLPPYTYQWTGGGGLTSSDSCFSHSFPGNGLYPYQLVMTDSAGCTDTVNGNVVVNVSINADAGPDISYCHGDRDTLGGPPSPNEVYTWTPGTGLNDSTLSDPIITLGNTGTNPITQTYILEVRDTVTLCVDYDTVNVTVFPIPEATFTLDPTNCMGEAETITYTGFNGAGATYSWDFGVGATPATANTQGPHSVTWSSQGVKTVTLTVAENGCTSSVAMDFIDVRPVPTTVTQEYQVNCFGDMDGAVDVDASGGFNVYTYAWSNGGNTDSLFGLGPGQYIVTVTDSSGCEVIDTANVFEPPLLTINPIVQHVNCFGGSDGAIAANVLGGNGNYGYQWLPGGQTTPAISNLLPGTYIINITDTSSRGAICTATDTIVIDEPTPLVLSITGTNISCNGGNNGTAIVTATGATPPYSYAWNTTPVQPSDTATGLTAGTWQVVVTDDNGCQDSIDVTLTEPPLLVVTGVTTPVTCNGDGNGTATAGPSGGTAPYLYSWNTTPVQTTQTATGLSGGTYTCIVTDALGCTEEVTVIVVEPLAVNTIISLGNVSCFGGSDGSLQANASGGVGGFTYLWSPNGATTAMNANLPAGLYSVIVTDANGCSDTTDARVYEPPLLTATADSIPTRCFIPGDDGVARAYGAGGTPPYSYSWNTTPVQNTQWATGLPAGTYTCTVTDAKGCQTTVTVDVTEILDPVVTAGPDVSFCEGDGGAQIFATGIQGTQPYYYSWWCDTVMTYCGLDSVNDNDPIANPNTTTTYYVQITDFNGCQSNVDSLVVTVLDRPEVFAGPDTYICTDSAPCVNLNPVVTGAPGPFQYQWTPSAGLSNDTIANPCARPDTTTIYTLQVVASNGCPSYTTTVDTNSTVIVNVNPLPIAEAGPDRDICYGDSAMLQGYGFGAGPSYEFQWSPAVSLTDSTIPNPLAFPSLNTAYVLTVWSNGCPSYGDTVQVRVHTNPTNDAGPDVEICLGDTALLDGMASGDSTATYTYQWWDGTGVIGPMNLEDLVASPDTTHTYYMVATTNHGCSSGVDSATIYVKPSPRAEAGEQQFICYPDTVQLNSGYYYTTTDSVQDTTQIWYTWTPGADIDDPNTQDPNVWPSQSQFYYLTVQHNTCFHTDSVLVTVFPELGSTIAADTGIICQYDSVQLSSTGGLGGASFTWTPQGGLSDPSNPNPMAAPDSSTTYTLIVSEGGCSDTLEIPISVIPSPKPSYLSSVREGCIPHTVTFIQNTADAIYYIWDFGDGEVINEENPTHTYTSGGIYTVTLTAVNSGGCSAVVDSIVINALDTASVDFTSNPEYPVVMQFPNTAVNFIDLSSPVTDWLWKFGDGEFSNEQNPVHTYTETGEFFVTLRVNNENGCRSEATHGPYVIMTPELFIPNVFSPNDDGINDTWMVQYTGSQYFFVEILDRWGASIYKGRDKYEGWNGRDDTGKSVPEGVYYYVVKVGDREFSGEVTLLR